MIAGAACGWRHSARSARSAMAAWGARGAQSSVRGRAPPESTKFEASLEEARTVWRRVSMAGRRALSAAARGRGGGVVGTDRAAMSSPARRVQGCLPLQGEYRGS